MHITFAHTQQPMGVLVTASPPEAVQTSKKHTCTHVALANSW
jgi:hypothetical protein